MNTYDRLYNLAKEIDASVIATEQAAESGRRSPLIKNIGAGLGTVTVAGSGSLLSIDLNRDAVGTQTGASLAGHVLRAINDAEHAASVRQDAMIAEASRRVES
ncbi:YbaB/EbfC family nucleoid-associated protein [Amycolatopsis sp. NPDC089917]|uniref:YbaB/EbfC family nucleoid-associated protein n=1 Tax=Amycolatopsis sp. NPDC089917 TaxID=3155187 RepID=UPI00341D178D